MSYTPQTAAEYHASKLPTYAPEAGYPPLNNIHRTGSDLHKVGTNSGTCSLSQDKANQYALLLEAAADLVSPDHYGHAIPLEVRQRFSRILSLGKPKLSGVGYEPPPPPRCEKCDSE